MIGIAVLCINTSKRESLPIILLKLAQKEKEVCVQLFYIHAYKLPGAINVGSMQNLCWVGSGDCITFCLYFVTFKRDTMG